MTDLKGIKGFTVQTFANNTAGTLAETGTWASDAPAPQTTQAGGSFGTSTAAVSSGGYDGTAYVQTTIEYNGSSWSSGGSMNRPAGQSFPGFGTEPSGGIAGGYKTSGNAVVNNFESYNGTAFTESTDLNSARQSAGATGASATAGIVVGGTTGVASPPDTTGNNNVEIWNGSSWTEIAEINTARYNLKALGSTCPAPTAVVTGGENSGTKTGITEKYDGSSWSESGDMNTARSGHGGAGNVATSGICFGGEGPASGGYTVYAQTEAWNGTSWTEVSDLSAGRYQFGTATGTGSAAIAGQGRNPGFTGLTEIWTLSPTFTQVNLGQVYFNSTDNAFKVTEQPVPGGTWASQTSMNTARNQSGSSEASPSSQGVIVGGNEPPESAKTELWNGSAWTETSDLNVGRRDGGSGGIYTSMGYFGGTGPGPDVASNELWNGSTWTESADLNDGRQAVRGSGSSSTSLLCFGGGDPSYRSITEQFDGTSWTEVNDMNRAREANPGSGSVPTTICAGGLGGVPSPGTAQAVTELFDGTSWTEVADLNDSRWGGGCIGTSASALMFGGDPPHPTYTGNTEAWNGTAWTEVANLATSRGWTNGFGTPISAIAAGGYVNPPAGQTAVVEEWAVDLTNSTVTIS